MDSPLISACWPRKLSWQTWDDERASGGGRRADRSRDHVRWGMATLHVHRRDPPCQLAPSTVIHDEVLSSVGLEACKIPLHPSSRWRPSELDFRDGTAFARFGAYDGVDDSSDRRGCGRLHDVCRA